MSGNNGNYVKCPICGDFGWENSHTCGPVYGVWDEDDDMEDAKDIHARCPEDAAEKFVSKRWEYQEETTVFVTDYSGNQWKFEVLAEQTITYSVNELEADKKCLKEGENARC